MISLILPYWDRQEAADKALNWLNEQYRYLFGLDLPFEVVVVDDGNAVPFRVPHGLAIEIRVVRRPLKHAPSSCISAWNEGVRQARGDVIALSCIEVLHTQPVLDEMFAELQRMGPNGYVLAAAFCPDTGEWHCHSSKGSAAAYPLPAGTGRSFCAMLHRSLYERVGGFDEDYAAGAGYEDVDFVYRLLAAGARFKIRDDLVVQHPKAGAAIAWPAGMFERNRALLERKWPKGPVWPITFACLNAGNYCERGAEYVNNLHDMVVRSMPPGRAFRFVCLTDNAEGLDERIEVMKLPRHLETWYGKLYLFKPGVFPDGERICFLDLDTVIVGRLDDIIGYRGPFATLEDFFVPGRVGPAVMMWEAGGPAKAIWTEWIAAGAPRHEMGDLWWVNQIGDGAFAARADLLQKLFPGAFVSYKKHCKPLPPSGARVVCFHGTPRPHEAEDEWVWLAWKVGGLQPADLDFYVNSSRETVARNVEAACKLPIPWLTMEKVHAGEAAIVGGGPSLASMLDELRIKASLGVEVFAVNGSFRYLVERGIVPDWHVIVDSRKENAKFVTTPPRRGYVLASQCAPETFARAMALAPVTLAHMNTEGIEKQIPPTLKDICLISAGITVGLAAIAISYVMGHRRQYLYGMDSSYEDSHHVYPQPLNDGDAVVEATAGGRTFKCAPWMIAQAQGFQKLAKELADDGCEIQVRSYGLLGYVAWLWTQQARAA